ncbi:sporulation-delaying protein SdpB family protein [Micromonospora sp. NPDC050397]|uniref:sporulation-delaying protein SdpB family protein n=1 Tax=Micromonospora sp. NPDC050397 TaxID=3364279 RepID=UPI00384D5F72
MLTRSLISLGRWARPRLAEAPWGSGLGLARTLLALATLGTLLATSSSVLLSPLADGTKGAVCAGPMQAGLWCVVPAWQGEAARWLSVAVLLVVASGWRPRFTGVLHWWVSWSLLVNTSIVDGGDQVTAVLTLLLIPVTLTDPRRWHWSRPPVREPGLARLVACVVLILVQVQVAVLYLHASVAKLGVREWADGTSLYYWLRNPTFGAPDWLRPLVDVVTDSSLGVALLTWGSVALEFALALAILLGPAAKRRLLVAGLLFHASIAIAMGLISFSTAMGAALLLYLLPIGHHLSPPRPALRLADRVSRLPARRREVRPEPARPGLSTVPSVRRSIQW